MQDLKARTIESLFENEVYKASVKLFEKAEGGREIPDNIRYAAQRVAQMAVYGLRSRRVVEGEQPS